MLLQVSWPAEPPQSDMMTVADVLLFSYSECVFLKHMHVGGFFGNQ